VKTSSKSSFFDAVAADGATPISAEAKRLWLIDLRRPMRWSVLPVLQFFFATLLHLTWFFKRLPLPQFRHHALLQKTICWFCKHFVSYEANILILRHFVTESNILNFVLTNTCDRGQFSPVGLFPLRIDDMLEHSFVRHDEELFRCFVEMKEKVPVARKPVWDGWKDVDQMPFQIERRWTQILDFETAHILFMCLFCFLLTAEEYQGAINGFNLDQSLAVRIEKITGLTGVAELAFNKHPLFLVGPWNLNQRFLMHGFFTEQVNAVLEGLRAGRAS
jgi:hypothetical protein